MRIGIALAVALAATAGLLAQTSAGADASTAQAQITIFARPTVIGWAQSATLFGAARGATPQDTVTIEVKDCGSTFFKTFVEAHVGAGGGWSTPVGSGITSTFRAVWRDATSAAVTIRQAANVSLARRRSGSGFVVAVIANRSFWRKRVEIQQRRRGAWRTIRTVVLTDSVSSTGTVSASEATFRLKVPKGTQLRALLPLAQARPCYVQSMSKTVRA